MPLLEKLESRLEALVTICVFISIVYSLVSNGFTVINALYLIAFIIILFHRNINTIARLLILYILFLNSFSLTIVQSIILVPLSIVFPLAFSKSISKKWSTRLDGSIVYTVSRYLYSFLLLMSIPALFKIAMMVPLITTIATLTLYTLYYNILLRRVIVEARFQSSRVVVEYDIGLIVEVNTPTKARLKIYVDEEVYTLDVSKGYTSKIIKIMPKNVGEQIVRLKIYGIDKWGFSSIKIVDKYCRVEVIPTIEYLILKSREVLKEGLEYPVEIRSSVDIRSRTSGLTPSRSITGFLRLKLLEVLGKHFDLFYKGSFGEPHRGHVWVVVDRIGKHGVRSRFGEYRGARYYVPGDDLKSIHWKKTVSKQALVVKEVESPPTSLYIPFSSSRIQVVVLDPCASSFRELDKLLYTVLVHVINSIDREFILLIVLDNDFVLIRGKGVDVLKVLFELFEKIPRLVRYEYDSLGTIIPYNVINKLLVSKKYKLLKVMTYANMYWAKRFIGFLMDNRIVPKARVIVVHGASTSTRWSYTKFVLEETGYIVPRTSYISVDREYVDKMLKTLREYMARR